jgi:hypothetical protein
MSSPNRHLKLQIEQLELTGPPAVGMLEGTAPVDPLVVMSALEACGLVDARRLAGDALRVHRNLVALAHTSDLLAAVLAQVDLRPEVVDLAHASDEDDLEVRLDALVALAGVHVVLPDRLSARTLGVLERNWTWAALHPHRALVLVSAAESHQAALDLPATHPVHALLESVLEAEVELARPPLNVDWDRAVLEAERALFPAPWKVFAATLAEQWRKLGELLTDDSGSVTPAYASSGQSTEYPQETIQLRKREELAIRRVGRNLQLLWAGDGPLPSSATLSGRPLRAAPAPVPGTAAWWLESPPDSRLAAFAVHWPGREWRVVVGEEEG